MKAVGIVRGIDNTGRFVVPAELREKFGLEGGDKIEVFTEEDCIILKKYEPVCMFCGEVKGVFRFGEKNICSSCGERIGKCTKK